MGLLEGYWVWGGVLEWGKDRTPNPLWAKWTLPAAGWPGLNSTTVSGIWALIDSVGDSPGIRVVPRCESTSSLWTLLPLTQMKALG